MKVNKILILSLVLSSTLLLNACFDDNKVEGPVTPVSLTIVVDDGTNPVSGATVELFNNIDDYIAETNAVATAQTDAAGEVTFDAAALGTEATKFYFNVASGTQRNWNFVSSTPVMTLTNGATVVSTSVGDLPPGFVYLAGNRFVLTAYSYAGSAFVLDDNVFETCENDDIVEFKKDGSVWRFDATNKCATPSEFQLPLYDLDGTPFCSWGLSSDGTEIDIRDFDPYWDAGGDKQVDANIQINETTGTVTIHYGGPYNVQMTKN